MVRRLSILVAVCGLIDAGYSQEDSVPEYLTRNVQFITDAARSFSVSPRLLASIVYVEQTENVKPGEKLLDVIFAYSGYNSSVGIAQIKVNTAEWLSEQIHSPASPFHFEENARLLIPPACNREELVRRLSSDSTNLLYAAAYLGLIEGLWREVLNCPGRQQVWAGIIATLYSLGIVRSDGSIRLPHSRARLNEFGRKAQEFFDSFVLREEFPE